MPKRKKKTENLSDVTVTKGNILIDPVTDDEKVDGIVRPKSYEDKAYKGSVIKDGDGVYKPGTVVYFNMYSSTVFPWQGEEYLMLKTEDIVAYHD